MTDGSTPKADADASRHLTGPVEGFAWDVTAAGALLRSTALSAVAAHGFTTRQLSFRGDQAAEDRRRLAATFGVDGTQLVEVKQVHGRAVRVLDVGSAAPAIPLEADAIVSTDTRQAIVVYVADCVPILLADRHARVVAAVHAGWRGTCARVAAAAVEAITELGVPAADLVAALGPSIGSCCYQVDGRVRTAFLGMTPDAAAWFAEDGIERWKLDLWLANADQLEAAGVPASAIHVAGLCTADHERVYYSYRREGGGAGRLAAAIRLGRPATV